MTERTIRIAKALAAVVALTLVTLMLPVITAGSASAATVSGSVTVGNAEAGFAPGASILALSDADLARELDLAAAAGGRWIRIDLDWARIEATQSRYDWSTSDRVITAARARGLQVLAMPTYAPYWANDGVSSKSAPTDPAQFARFVADAVARYAPQGVLAYEIWNEPNLATFWKPAPDPAAYATLLAAANAAVKSVAPGATVLVGGLSPATTRSDGTTIAPETFLSRMYAAGAAGTFDAVAVHPYSFPAQPTDASTYSWNTFQRLPLVRDLMVANGDSAKKVWLTEFGAPTGTASDAVTEAVQAQTITNGFAQARTWSSWIGPLFVYSLRDAGTDPTDREQSFGLVRKDFTAKPALAAFTAATTSTATAPTTTSAPSAPTSTTAPQDEDGTTGTGTGGAVPTTSEDGTGATTAVSVLQASTRRTRAGIVVTVALHVSAQRSRAVASSQLDAHFDPKGRAAARTVGHTHWDADGQASYRLRTRSAGTAWFTLATNQGVLTTSPIKVKAR